MHSLNSVYLYCNCTYARAGISTLVCCYSPPQAFAANMARQHYLLVIKRKAFHAMRRMIENKWRSRVERACKNKAQDVCMDLTAQYEAQINEVSQVTLIIKHGVHLVRLSCNVYKFSYLVTQAKQVRLFAYFGLHMKSRN